MRNRLEILVPLANTLFRKYCPTWEDIIKIELRGVIYKAGDFRLSSSTKVTNFFIGSRNAKFPKKKKSQSTL
jgi:hypothetical protein